MNPRAITTIMEQFIIFALGIVIFAMIVLSFRHVGDLVDEKNDIMGLSQGASYLAVNIIEVWEIANTGKDARVERTLSLPFDGTAEFRGREICLTTETGEECSPIPLDAELKGKAYTLGKFTLISTKEGVELKNV